ncbi:MAG: sugar phosphate isomerase/epimerase family protein [Phycisphaerales bacterium]
MILTLSVASVARLLSAKKGGMSLVQLPEIAHDVLGLRGLVIPTSVLTGISPADAMALRDAADKSACPCLVLIESDAQPLAAEDDRVDDAVERMTRVLRVAQMLGCNSVGVSVDAPDNEDAFENASVALKMILERADRLDINVLIAPHAGLTADPERLTDLIKKVGGFRIGTLPDFAGAAKAGEPEEQLRRTAPYAQAVIASSLGFDEKGEHQGYDLGACVSALQAVGFEQTLAIEYRGKGDPLEGVRLTRQAIERCLDTAAQP